MKAVSLSLFLLLLTVHASADDRYITPLLRHEWRNEYPRIQTDINHSIFLLGIRCDTEFNAAIQQRFRHLDQESLALYNRGLLSPPVVAPTTATPPKPR